jgi:hypothetical protein
MYIVIQKFLEEVGKETLRHLGEEKAKEIIEAITPTHQLTIYNSKNFDIFCAIYMSRPHSFSFGWLRVPSRESMSMGYQAFPVTGTLSGLYACSADGTFTWGSSDGTLTWHSIITHDMWVGSPKWGLGKDARFVVHKPMVDYYGTSAAPFRYPKTLEAVDGISGVTRVSPRLRLLRHDYKWTVS